MTLEDIRNDTKHSSYICHYVNKGGEVDWILLSKEQILNCEWAQFYFNGGYKQGVTYE